MSVSREQKPGQRGVKGRGKRGLGVVLIANLSLMPMDDTDLSPDV